jgi:hypothetical protein
MMAEWNCDVRTALRMQRESHARIAESFAKDYGAEIGHMAKRIAEVIRRLPLPAPPDRITGEG